jgi:hypothetical protein
MSEHEADTLPKGPLTELEQQAVRSMLRDYNRSRWLARLMLKWAAYISATVAFLATFKSHLGALFQR